MSDYSLSAEEARVLDELAEMRESDPEGYAAVLADAAPEASPDPAQAEQAHAEWLLKMLTGEASASNKVDQDHDPLLDLLSQAFAAQASLEEAEKQ